MSLNQVVTHQVEDLPALLDEMKSAPSLHFRLERKGVLVPLDVQLR
jgi:type II secretory pathway component PulC